MAGEGIQWGCCTNETLTNMIEKAIKCPICDKSYHYACISLKEAPRNMSTWKCPSCLSNTPKVCKKDSTPIRNVTINRGSKRAAIASPSPPHTLHNNKNELRFFIRDVIKEEFNEMFEKFKTTMISTIHQEIEPVKKEMQEILDSMVFINKNFEDIQKEHEIAKENMKRLETENKALKTTVENLTERLNNLEQNTRSNNLEVQCVPENKNENVYNIITQLARVVNCEIGEKDVLHCTRIAKNNKTSTRPRSIVVQLASPRVRDQLLAATVKYNQANPNEKLNCCHLGYAGPKSPVYITEHLSPANRALHAATRVRAKERNYKYVWVRNGRIFVRKSDGADFFQIKDKNGLAKIV